MLHIENLSAGSEPGELGEYRRKLLAFLETSKFYKAEKLITHFPQGSKYSVANTFNITGCHNMVSVCHIRKQICRQYGSDINKITASYSRSCLPHCLHIPNCFEHCFCGCMYY